MQCLVGWKSTGWLIDNLINNIFQIFLEYIQNLILMFKPEKLEIIGDQVDSHLTACDGHFGQLLQAFCWVSSF